MAEALTAKRARAKKILAQLERVHPKAAIALRFTTPLELLVATILAAQCTDERVNQVTASLFKKYRTASDYARADSTVLEEEIRSTGFYKAKARSILGTARMLQERWGGEVPHILDELIQLPGVGRKTANVVLGNAYGQQAIAVDTHVFRVSQRLGLAKSTNPDEVEGQLRAVLPASKRTRSCHLFQFHGRATCHARRPDCPYCAIRALCPWPEKTAAS